MKMKIEPKIRGFICTTAHPLGCRAHVKAQLDYVKSKPRIVEGAKNVLIIGASTGYGLASRLVAGFACGAKTLGVSFEKPACEKRTASAGWYNTAAFESFAKEAGLYAKSLNGDAFSDELKQQTIRLIRQEMGKIDLVIYSLASPRRQDPRTEKTYHSTLKPIDCFYQNKTVDTSTGEIKDVSLEPASQVEIDETVAVMGGEDWERWIDALIEADLLADGAITLAYNYIGPELTHPIYKDGTIGMAKEHLQQTANALHEKLIGLKGRAHISVNKALVTQASSAIPVVPLYISILYKLMKEAGTHEGCIEQMYRLFHDFLYSKKAKLDTEGRIRLDDLEMQADIQEKVAEIWPTISSENVYDLTDLGGYVEDFHHLFGFGFPGIDYQAEVETEVPIESIT